MVVTVISGLNIPMSELNCHNFIGQGIINDQIRKIIEHPGTLTFLYLCHTRFCDTLLYLFILCYYYVFKSWARFKSGIGNKSQIFTR